MQATIIDLSNEIVSIIWAHQGKVRVVGLNTFKPTGEEYLILAGRCATC